MEKNTESESESEIAHTLGDFTVTEDLAREDDAFDVFDLPADMVDDHLTKTFTPGRYARICRDVAYFSRVVGNAPQKGMGQDYGDPGSGMRRSKEGALYGLAHREAILKRAVEMDLIDTTNEDGFEADESELVFEITDRGAWFVQHYYGNHVPIRRIKRVKLSRHSTALNSSKYVVNPEGHTIKSHDEWQEQMESREVTGTDPDTGYYHVSADVVDAPETDPADEELVTWIDESSVPKQFDLSGVDADVHLTVDPDEIKSGHTRAETTFLRFEKADDGDIYVSEIDDEGDIHIGSVSGANKISVLGDYDPFVTSGGKDALKESTDAEWSSDYQCWYVPPEELLIGVEAMLEVEGVDGVTAYGETIKQYVEYL